MAEKCVERANSSVGTKPVMDASVDEDPSWLCALSNQKAVVLASLVFQALLLQHQTVFHSCPWVCWNNSDFIILS